MTSPPDPDPNSAVPLRVAFVTSHPIQYQVPVFRYLEQDRDIEFVVLFAMLPDAASQGAGFGVAFEWDIPLLEGYQYRVLENVSASPGVTSFKGCDTPGIEAVLRELRVDVVVCNGWVVKTCLQALRAARKMKVPCLVRGEANHLRPRPWWKKLLQRQLVRSFSGFLPIGTANRDFYRSYGIAGTVMFDAPYCIENERFERAADEAAPRRAAIRAGWGVPDSAACFVYCGKFEEKKHPLELLQSLESAVQDGADLHLLMVGDGELRAECEAFAESRKLPVTMTGFLNQSQIVDAYAAGDCLVLPSDHGETWGLVVNESFACGKPAIVSDQIGCAQDLIRSGVTGWTFSFGNWGELASLLKRVSEELVGDTDYALACRTKVAEYSPSRAADGIAAAACALTGRPRRRQQECRPEISGSAGD